MSGHAHRTLKALILFFALLCLSQLCNAFILQSPVTCFDGRLESRKSRCARFMMAGGFGNKAKPTRNSAPKKKNSSPALDPAIANPSAQKAIMDVKQIVDGLDENEDPFWQLIGPLLLSEYNAADIQRVLDFIKYSTGKLPLPDSIVQDKWRPHEDIHAFMVIGGPLLQISREIPLTPVYSLPHL